MRTLILASLLALSNLTGIAAAADGQLDPTFLTDAEVPGYGFYVNPNGTTNDSLDMVGAIVERPDNKLWVVGRMKAPGAYRLSLYRVEPNGYPDVGFGDLGLRTVVQPCAGFYVAGAKLDSQGRLLVAIDHCPDFMVYRFLPNGDLDATFATGGVLSVPFNQGGTNTDKAKELMIAPNGDLIIAGRVETATSASLGVARFTSSGLPVPGFGVTGKVLIPFEWQLSAVYGVNGLHLMEDGRIVITGSITETNQGTSDAKQFVVRLAANGVLDPSFGNSSAGISKVNHKSALGVVESPDTVASLMMGDGSIVQVGTVVSNNLNSSGDIFLMRWRPDGQLDTTIGLNGTRQYSLDFAGPNPSDPGLNFEIATNILRQDNGDLLILASSNIADSPATAVMRLKSNLNIDPSFGSAGKVQYTMQINNGSLHGQVGSAMMLQKGRILFGGAVITGVNGRMQIMMGLQHDEIFAHTFD